MTHVLAWDNWIYIQYRELQKSWTVAWWNKPKFLVYRKDEGNTNTQKLAVKQHCERTSYNFILIIAIHNNIIQHVHYLYYKKMHKYLLAFYTGLPICLSIFLFKSAYITSWACSTDNFELLKPDCVECTHLTCNYLVNVLPN